MDHLLRSVQIIQKMRNSVLFVVIFLLEADGWGKGVAVGSGCFDLADLLNQRSDSGVQIIVFPLELVHLADKGWVIPPAMVQTGSSVIFIPIFEPLLIPCQFFVGPVVSHQISSQFMNLMDSAKLFILVEIDLLYFANNCRIFNFPLGDESFDGEQEQISVGSCYKFKIQFERILAAVIAAAVMSALVHTSDRRPRKRYFFFVEQPPLESSQLLLVFLIEDDGDPVDLLGVVGEERLHEGVVEGVAEIREGVHYPYFIVVDLDGALPLLLILAQQVHC